MIPVAPINVPASEYHTIYIRTTNGSVRIQEGIHREDLDAEHPNWHYYQEEDGTMIHVRKKRMVFVIDYSGIRLEKKEKPGFISWLKFLLGWK